MKRVAVAYNANERHRKALEEVLGESAELVLLAELKEEERGAALAEADAVIAWGREAGENIKHIKRGALVAAAKQAAQNVKRFLSGEEIKAVVNRDDCL